MKVLIIFQTCDLGIGDNSNKSKNSLKTIKSILSYISFILIQYSLLFSYFIIIGFTEIIILQSESAKSNMFFFRTTTHFQGNTCKFFPPPAPPQKKINKSAGHCVRCFIAELGGAHFQTVCIKISSLLFRALSLPPFC